MAHARKPAVPVASLAVVLPCRNEAANVERVVAEVIGELRAVVRRLEVVVVNDGSTDATGATADRIAASDPDVRVVHNPRNLGYGGALRAGFAVTTADWVFYTDGDGQLEPGQLRDVMPLLPSCDAVIGWRVRRAEGVARRLKGRCWTWLTNRVFGTRYRDIDCAFKIFPGWFVRETPWLSTGALISAELVARARRAGLSISEVGVRHRPRIGGEATGADVGVAVRAFRELFVLARAIGDEPEVPPS